MWHDLKTVETLDTGDWYTEVPLPLESSWFPGHFPGDPILPGIAQLAMVYEAACRGLGERFRVVGFSRVKFKKIIRPGDCLKITVLSKKNLPGLYAFRIVDGDDLACTGTLALETRNDPADAGGV